MDSTPAYLKGRGRGRARGRGHKTDDVLSKPKPATSIPGGLQNSSTNNSNFHENDKKNNDAQERFEAISNKHRASASKYLQQVELSDDEDEAEGEELKENIIESIFKSYSISNDNGEKALKNKAQDDLIHSFRSATSACLVCIETIRKEEAIWCCRGCAGMFHITCIQKWVKEGAYQFNYKSDNDVPTANIPWYCPKCRHEYEQKDCPSKYYCFCGKVADPPFDPWLVPHSCGQTCNRRLKPDCGHTCLLLCHPGPCPPCPKTIKSTCYCGKKTPQMKRCSNRYWACSSKCGKLLSCNQHSCQQICHEGECAPCTQTSEQLCRCGRHSEVRPCSSPDWKCKEVCNKVLNCKNHLCEKVCHSSDCGNCPRLGLRSCPCGKTQFELPCTEDIPPCGDTCEKLLACGQHKCLERCHTGPCTPCQHITIKRCRCGRKQKETLCSKEFNCDSKCNKQKNCGRHQCKKKCCKGNCPPCDQICGKPLGCRNHKCASPCHSGPCYPCPLTVDVFCYCKSTKVTVPCGKEKNTRKPKCNLLCRKPPTCHHEVQSKHRCHFNECPPCRQICGLNLPNCEHKCPLPCHDEIKVKTIEKTARIGPWDPKPREIVEIVQKPCAPCRVLLPQSCLGNHEISQVECSKLGVYNCRQPCGRILHCTNHTCTLTCHNVLSAKDSLSAGTNCQSCDELCMKERPPGCNHSCPLPCHAGDCPPCQFTVKTRCHCNSIIKQIPCLEWASATPETKAALRSCGARCPKDMACGHRCLSPCHNGTCPEVKCQQLIKVTCRCKRLSRQAICFDYHGKKKYIDCDAECEKIRAEKKAKEDEAERLKKEEQERKEREELEAFERKMKGRKRRQLKEYEEVIEPSWCSKHGKTILVTTSLILGILLFCYFVYTCID